MADASDVTVPVAAAPKRVKRTADPDNAPPAAAKKPKQPFIFPMDRLFAAINDAESSFVYEYTATSEGVARIGKGPAAAYFLFSVEAGNFSFYVTGKGGRSLLCRYSQPTNGDAKLLAELVLRDLTDASTE